MKEKKDKLRKLIALKKTDYCDSTLKKLSEEIWEQLELHPDFLKANIILLYFSMKDEVNTHSFIERWSNRKQFLLPVVKGTDLELRPYEGMEKMQIGAYGIYEPTGEAVAAYNQINLVIVPGVAFNIEGLRLGRGKGYYDRLLPLIQAKKIGVCFSFQLVDEIPSEGFDVRMDEVLYNKEPSETQY